MIFVDFGSRYVQVSSRFPVQDETLVKSGRFKLVQDVFMFFIDMKITTPIYSIF